MSGVIHARSDNMIQTLTKYQHFLFHSMQKNGFRSDQATVAGTCLAPSAVACFKKLRLFLESRMDSIHTVMEQVISHQFFPLPFPLFRFQSTQTICATTPPYDTRQHHNRMANKDAMGCSVVNTHDILKNERTCRKVKEFANILSIGHQKLACLNAGYSEEHCMNDFSCCLTYEKNPE